MLNFALQTRNAIGYKLALALLQVEKALKKGLLLRKRRDLLEADRCFQEHLSPLLDDLSLAVARLARCRGDLLLASYAYERCLRCRHVAVDPFIEYASVLIRLGEPQAAVRVYWRATKVDPSNAEVLYLRGLAKRDVGDYA